jgi:hypothetical protein
MPTMSQKVLGIMAKPAPDLEDFTAEVKSFLAS